MTNLGSLVSSSSPPPPAEVKPIQHGPGPPGHSYWAGYSKGLVVIFQEPGKGEFFLGDVQGLGNSSPLSYPSTDSTMRMGCLASGEEMKVENVH